MNESEYRPRMQNRLARACIIIRITKIRKSTL